MSSSFFKLSLFEQFTPTRYQTWCVNTISLHNCLFLEKYMLTRFVCFPDFSSNFSSNLIKPYFRRFLFSFRWFKFSSQTSVWTLLFELLFKLLFELNSIFFFLLIFVFFSELISNSSFRTYFRTYFFLSKKSVPEFPFHSPLRKKL